MDQDDQRIKMDFTPNPQILGGLAERDWRLGRHAFKGYCGGERWAPNLMTEPATETKTASTKTSKNIPKYHNISRTTKYHNIQDNVMTISYDAHIWHEDHVTMSRSWQDARSVRRRCFFFKIYFFIGSIAFIACLYAFVLWTGVWPFWIIECPESVWNRFSYVNHQIRIWIVLIHFDMQFWFSKVTPPLPEYELLQVQASPEGSHSVMFHH